VETIAEQPPDWFQRISSLSASNGASMAKHEPDVNTTGILSQRDRRAVDYILKPGDGLTKITGRQLPAATHLIAGFEIGVTGANLDYGTVVCFEGNRRGTKAAGCVILGPNQLGTAPRGFWTRLEDDLVGSARIDRQKSVTKDGAQYCDYHVQFENYSVACVLVRVEFDVGARAMRRAFNLSLDLVKNVWVAPAEGLTGQIRHEK
jgi:hypothetical protein